MLTSLKQRASNIFQDNMSLIIFFIVFILGLIFLIFVIVLPSNEPKCSEEKPIKEEFTAVKDFKIYNYLKRPISLDILEGNSAGEIVSQTPVMSIHKIDTQKSGGMSQTDVIKYLKPGNMLKFWVWTTPKDKIHYTDYIIDTYSNERIKALHVGMITTRFLGSTDTFRLTVTNANAGQGQPWLKIHNLTYLPLNLNHHIAIEPHQVNRYQGYLHMGVPLGTYLKDDQSLYPDYQYLKPYSDIFYGVVSDIQQPLDGCWQLEYSDRCDFGQSLWPLEDGVY